MTSRSSSVKASRQSEIYRNDEGCPCLVALVNPIFERIYGIYSPANKVHRSIIDAVARRYYEKKYTLSSREIEDFVELIFARCDTPIARTFWACVSSLGI